MRKIILFSTLLLWVTCINAQQTSYDTLKVELHKFYDDLDHSNMQTNYLLNRGFLLLNQLEDWNKGNPSISSLPRWSYFCKAIEESDLTLQTELPNIKKLQSYNKIDNYGVSSIALSVLNFKGDYLTKDYIQTMVEKDLPPNYTALDVFAGTILHSTSYNRTVDFIWNPKLYFSNKNNDAIIEVDFGDKKGYRYLDKYQKQTIPITYNGIGEKSIMFRCIEGKDTLVSYSKLNVMSLEMEAPTYTKEIVIYDSVPEKPNTLRDNNPDVSLWKANYDYYEGYDHKLDKPVIIAEGFDIAGNMTTNFYKKRWSSLIRKLRNKGYDIFILNFRAPNRDLRDNAQIVKKLIKGINDEKKGHYEGVYIGESMGGVIGRIALKQMEDENYDHQIGLFVPYDSPFKGANIPLGIQFVVHDAFWSLPNYIISATYLVEMIEYIFGIDVPYVDIYQQLTSKAAKQMFVRHFKGNSDYNELQNYLKKLGYPKLSRNVAFTNGSNSSNFQNVSQGQRIFKITQYWGLVNLHVFSWYAKLNSRSKVSEFKYSNMGIFDFHLTWENRYVYTNNQFFDNAPGGYIEKEINGSSIKFCFVPTLSAIDIDNSKYTGNLDYYNAQHPKQYLIEHHLTPFDDIYSRQKNTPHTSNRTSYNQWDNVLEEQEIMYNQMYLQNRVINKNRDFEASISITAGYDVQPLSFSYNYYYPELYKYIKKRRVTIQQGAKVQMEAGNSITLSPGFRVKAGCEFSAKIVPQDPTIRKKEHLPPVPTIKGERYICQNSIYQTNEGSLFTEWTLRGNEIEIEQQSSVFEIENTLPVGQYTLYCFNGESLSSKVVIIPSREQCNQLESLKSSYLQEYTTLVYPNPTKGEFTIQQKHQIQKGSAALKDISGKIVFPAQILNKKNTAFNIAHLPVGTYFLEIQIGNKTETHKIIKI